MVSYPHCCIMYVYTDDLNHHLQATGVGCFVEGARVNSLSYADDMVLLGPTELFFRHSWRYVAHTLDLMTLYTTQRKQYVCWSGQSNSGLEMRNLALYHDCLQTVEMIRILKNNSGVKM